MTLPAHLFVDSTDGALYDTRTVNWYKLPPLRANYVRTHRIIETVSDLKATLRNGQCTTLGGYPLYFMVDDGEALSFEAVRQELPQVIAAIQDCSNDGWRVVACMVNDEDTDLHCAHTNARIPAASG